MRGPKNPYRLTNLHNSICGFSSSGFPFDEGKGFGRKKNIGSWPRSRGLVPRTLTSAHTDCPWIALHKVKVVTVPTLSAFPGRELIVQARSRAVRVVNIVHPCRVNLFEKPYPWLWTTW